MDYIRGIYKIYPNLIKENRRMSTCNRLDLQTLGSQPIMPKNLPDHCSKPSAISMDFYSCGSSHMIEYNKPMVCERSE